MRLVPQAVSASSALVFKLPTARMGLPSVTVFYDSRP